jgi:hypothetical protein
MVSDASIILSLVFRSTLNFQPSTINYLAGVLSVATFFSKTIPVLVGHTGLVLTSRHAGWGKTR